jgi:Ca2+-binding EF-hand superfamily protein
MKYEHWKGVSTAARIFVRALLEVDAEKRLTAIAALKDPWITNHCPETQLDFQPMVSAFRAWILAPKFLRAIFSLMAWQLSNDQQAKVRDYFLAMDGNFHGAISLSELRSILVEKHGVSEEEVGAVFTILIETHDPEIHYSDFLAVMACDSMELDDDLLRSTFQKFDTKGVGYISAGDVHEVLGVSLKDGEADAFIQEADVLHRDGHIVYDEFLAYINSSRWRLKHPGEFACRKAVARVLERGPTLLETRISQGDGSKPPKVPKAREVSSRFFHPCAVPDTCCCCCLM